VLKYIYFYHGNAFFRRVADTIRAEVDDVWLPKFGARKQGEWVRYTGDPQEVYCFGNKIGFEQLPADARAASEEPTKAFQILAARKPKKPKPR
jgi:hypothetical protein